MVGGGGALGGGITRGITGRFLNGKGGIRCAAACGLSPATKGRWFARHAAGNSVGSVLGDAGFQWNEIRSGRQQQWSPGQSLMALATGFTTGLAGAKAQWKYLRVCFAAGTPLLTPEGSKAIEDFRPGDLVLSRDENNPDGPVVAKVVEEVFVRTGFILHLHIGGQVIRTTAEHPFYVKGKGWMPAGALQTGDLISSHCGRWIAVEEVYATGEVETVYNLKVADYHTYFVGSSTDWGFSAWTHNRSCQPEDVRAAAGAASLQPLSGGRAYAIRKRVDAFQATKGSPEDLATLLREYYPDATEAQINSMLVSLIKRTDS